MKKNIILHVAIAFAIAFFGCLFNQALGTVFAIGVCLGYEAYKLVRNHSKKDIIKSLFYMVINLVGIAVGLILVKLIMG